MTVVEKGPHPLANGVGARDLNNYGPQQAGDDAAEQVEKMLGMFGAGTLGGTAAGASLGTGTVLGTVGGGVLGGFVGCMLVAIGMYVVESVRETNGQGVRI